MKKPIQDCLICDRPLQSAITWGALLTRQFPATICERCDSKFERITVQQEEDVISLYHYNEAMKDYIHRYKFMHDVVLAHVFRAQLHAQLANQAAIIVPVPMHEQNMKKRTFSHLDEMLRAAGLPFEQFLTKTTTETQIGKTREQRMSSERLFEVIANEKIRNKSIIIVDDIYTTGTTIKHSKQALFEAGASSVTAFTLIHG